MLIPNYKDYEFFEKMRSTEEFEFKIADGMDKPAIWLRVKNREVIVNPLEIYNTLFERYDIKFSTGIQALFLIYKDEVWGHFQDYSCGSYRIEFPRSSFIESAQRALKELCNTVLRGEKTAYEKFETSTAEKMEAGLRNLIIPKNYFQIMEDEVKVERFSFDFVEPYDCDTQFVLKIGERTYESYISEGETHFNHIRSSIENLLEKNDKKGKLELYFEDSPTIIRLNKLNVYNSDYRIVNNNIIKVTLIPNEFVHEPNIYAWCDFRQLLSALYLGLLSICVRETDRFDDYKEDWRDFRLATYNKLQSCVIENYINGIKEDDFTYMPRQRLINSVEEMMEDYNNLKKTLSI